MTVKQVTVKQVTDEQLTVQQTTFKKAAIAALVLTLTAGCAASEKAEAPDVSVEGETAEDAGETAFDAILAGAQRSDKERARDGFRNPKETLAFFGIEPDMTVVEIWPGGGWYTNILAPYLATGDGVYYAAHFDPDRSERAANAVSAFTEKYTTAPETFGEVNITILGEGADIAPKGSADMVLTFRNVHNWAYNDSAPAYFAKFHDALRPGGVLGVVEHRADNPDTEVSTGYVTEDAVIALAEAAGFELVDRSEINANPADTKDHPYGVWTLPPVRRSTDRDGNAASDFDRAKYDAIGESDRMTLKFRKAE